MLPIQLVFFVAVLIGRPAGGDVIAFARIDVGTADLYLLDTDTGQTRNITKTPDRDEWAPAWSGGRLAWFEATSGSTNIVIGLHDGTVLQRFVGVPEPIKSIGNHFYYRSTYRLSWHPTQNSLAYLGAAGGAVILDWPEDNETGEPEIRRISIKHTFGPYIWSPNGLHLFNTFYGVWLRVLTAEGTLVKQNLLLPNGGTLGNDMVFDHLYHSLAFVSSSISFVCDGHCSPPTKDTHPQIHTLTPPDTVLTRLTTSPTHKSHPTWSPDGLTIAFAEGDGADWDLVAIDVASGVQHALLAGPADDFDPAYAPGALPTLIRTTTWGRLKHPAPFTVQPAPPR